MIVKSLEAIANILTILIVLGSAIGGAAAGGFLGFIGGLIGGAVVAVIFLGALFLFMDIADNVRRTANALEHERHESVPSTSVGKAD